MSLFLSFIIIIFFGTQLLFYINKIIFVLNRVIKDEIISYEKKTVIHIDDVQPGIYPGLVV